MDETRIKSAHTLEDSMKFNKGTEDAEEEGEGRYLLLQQSYHLSIYHHHCLVHPLKGIVIFIQQIIYRGFLSRGDHSSMGLGQIS